MLVSKTLMVIGAAGLLFAGDPRLPSPTPDAQPRSVPLFRVHVIDPSTVAVNYSERQRPVKIGFEGTVLMPQSKGEARIVSRTGATEVEAKIEGLLEPSRFGREYLTYVLWALTPNGRAANLGQLVANHKNEAKVRTATEFQTFALIVTAEPHHAVAAPSGMVVLENVMQPDTVGRVEKVQVNSALLQRGEVTYEMDSEHTTSGQPMVSMKEYEALVELYQAQNALYMAKAADADRHAYEIYVRAERLMGEARSHYAAKDMKHVVMVARAATQAAEDARLIAVRTRQAETSPVVPTISSR